MKAKDRSFPYPVLSPFRDDVQPNSFVAELSLTPDPQSYHLDYRLALQNPTLVSLIESAKATYGVHVECRGNFFRQLFRSNKQNDRITIPADDLTGTVEVSFFVTAATAMNDYVIEGAHADYAGAVFSVRPGDVLAIAPAVTFDADKDFDPLKKISSILQICPDENLRDGAFVLDLGADKLTVFLAKADHERYAQLRGDARITATLVQSIVVPTLAETIAQMRQTPPNEADSESQLRWFRIIRQRLADAGEDYANGAKTPLELAQKLLSNPLGRCLKELLNVTEGEQRE